jgi:hypothetical protein
VEGAYSTVGRSRSGATGHDSPDSQLSSNIAKFIVGIHLQIQIPHVEEVQEPRLIVVS